MLGQQVGSYRIVERLAEGGMGVIYLARDQRLDRDVVVKVLQPQLVHDEELVRRFLNEARAAASITHPGIVDIFGVGEEDGLVYIAMERLRGESLAERLANGPLSCERASQLAAQLARALGAAHEQRVIHRDLKPENIFLVSDPEQAGGERIKVLDFGVAKLAPRVEVDNPTAKGSVFGTPAYMAPEQWQDAGSVDHRADLYAIGCILYEMLCGQPPFGRGSMELLAAHLRDQPAPPSRMVPDIPSSLENVVLRLLAKRPQHRPQDCQELLDMLERGDVAGTVVEREPSGSGVERSVEVSRKLSPVALRPSFPCVLVVDDNATNQVVATHMLRLLGTEVEIAKNGAEAVEKVRHKVYDLILMDCQMPVMDGFEATRRIRSLAPEVARVPIVAITAHRLLESREKCLSAGMNDYLTKPLRLEMLRRAVDQWCRNVARADTERPSAR